MRNTNCYSFRTGRHVTKLSMMIVLFIALVYNARAQITSYYLTATSGTYTPLTSGTTPGLTGGNDDDGYYGNIPIGFNFTYDGVVYKKISACTNGWLSLNGASTGTAYTNNLSGGTNRPIIAALWDDHDMSYGYFTYFSDTIGGASDSVFTAQWTDVDWQFQGGPTISFQIKLYKNSGAVEFIYNQEATSVSGTSASIGITASTTGSGNFLSLNSSGTSPSMSSTIETTNISTKPATGQIYRFYIPVPAAPVVTTGTNGFITTSQATLGGAIAPNTVPTVTASGVVVSTSSSPTVGGGGVFNFATSPLATTGSYSVTASGLSLGTLYHYRAYATNSLGTSYGPDSTFTTSATATVATVTSNAATNVGTTTTTLAGTIVVDGGSAVTTSGIVYSTSSSPAIGGPGVVDSTTIPLVTSGAFDFDLTGLTHGTKYYFRAYAINGVGTAYSALDSFTTEPIVSTFPYSQNFDAAGYTGWRSGIVSGSFNEWQLGTPAKTQISAAYSGTKAWVTNVTGFYSNNENAAVVSPQIDCSSLPADPLIKFQHNFSTEGSYDGGVLEISINGGAWTILDQTQGTGTNYNTAISTAWYNINAGNFYGPLASACWQDNSNLYSTANPTKWVQSQTVLTGAAGQANVKVRFRFQSDVSNVDEGWAFDDVQIIPASAPDVRSDVASGITSGNVQLSGNIISNGHAPVLSSGIVVSTSPAPVLGDPSVVDSTTNPLASANGVFTVKVDGLTSSTLYYYRAYAINAVDTSYGADSTFTTTAAPSLPLMSKAAPTNVGYAFATTGGMIVSDGGDPITASGIAYGPSPNPTLGDPDVIDMTTTPVVGWAGSGTFSMEITGLDASTKYYYRAYGINGVGTSYSVQDSFTTDPAIMTTGTAGNITISAANLHGSIRTITGLGNNSTITESGVVVSTSPAPAVGDPGVIDSINNPLVTTGAYAILVGNLVSNTTYYYRAYAINSYGIFYGEDSTFTTLNSAVPPTVNTTAAAAVTADAATIGGDIISDGGDPITSSGVVYGTSPNPAIGDPGVTDETTSPLVVLGTYDFNLTGLSSSTKYYFRSYAVNGYGTSYGIEDSFTTELLISTFPYLENFDGPGSTGWTTTGVSGGINDWQLGTPAKTQLSGAYSGTNAWVTKLSGNYSNSANCALVSPQMDCSSMTVDPAVRFQHNFDSETDWDGAVLEISISGGAWNRLDATTGTGTNFNTTTSTAWYNSDASNWSGPLGDPCWNDVSTSYSSANPSGWVQSTTILAGAAGQSDVRVRIRFESDPSFSFEGWAVDDMEILPATEPIMVNGNSTGITTSTAVLNGNIISDGFSSVTASGVIVSTSISAQLGDPGVMDFPTSPSVTSGTFNVTATGLSLSTLYYFRSYAINAVGTGYGDDSTFTTNAAAVAPTVNNTTASSITTTTANVGANIISDGGDAITSSGIVFATSSNPTLGGPGVVDSTTTPLAATGSYSFNLTGLNPGTTYYYRAYSTNSIGTGYATQDSFTTDPVVSTLPYMQNFDGPANTGWTTTIVTGSVNDWQLGTPAKTQLSGAYSGSNAWVTKLTGNYSNSGNSALISPQFDFSSLTLDPVVRFQHNFQSETDWDGAVLEISINGGAWTTLDASVGTGSNFNTTTSTGWYNSNTSFWSGPLTPPCWNDYSYAYSSVDPNGWVQSHTKLTGAAGQSNVKFRIRFQSDPSFSYEGWAIDDVEVLPVVAPTAVNGASTNITNTNATLEGTITDDGFAPVTASGIIVSTNTNAHIGDPGVMNFPSSPLATMGTFTISATGLTLSTQYYYRTYATNGVGTGYGNDSTFTTSATALAPTVTTTPASNIGGNTATVGGNIVSDGGDAVTTSGIVYSTSPTPVIGNPGVTDVTTSPLVATGVFTTNLTGLSALTKYYYRSYAINSIGTSYGTEDSLTTDTFIASLPYFENFDAGNYTGWNAASTGGSNDWVLGTPSKTQISGPYSSPNSWVTKTSGNYVNNHDGAVTSPQFDCSSLTSDPILSFEHNFVCESGYDGSVVEISIDNGAWRRVDSTRGLGTNFNTTNSYSWYNNNSTNGPLVRPKWSANSNLFASNSSNWIHSQTVLAGASGHANVKFRIRFTSDVSGTDEGWAFDDVHVFTVTTPTVQASAVTISNLTNTTADVSWTNGNGGTRIVVANPTTSTAVAPVNGTIYTANAAFGSGSTTGTNNYVVYAGTGTSVTVTGLSVATNYTFTVYEMNGSYMHNKFLTPGASNNGTTTPVKLMSFTGKNVNGDVVLNWATASEENNNGFEVQRSTDGKNFTKVTFVKGAGTTLSVQKYASLDEKAFEVTHADMLYYRLKQLDFDGKYEYTGVVSVSANTLVKPNAVTAYPNPFTYTTSLKVTSDVDAKATIIITDVKGLEVGTREIQLLKGDQNIPVTELENAGNGVYFVKVIRNNGETSVVRISKMN